MHVLGIERTGDNVAVAERTFAPSAFLPSPLGSSIAVAGGTTIAVMFDDGASELRKLAGAQLGTARSIAYTARVTEVARAGAQAVALRTGADLFAQAIDPAAFELGSSVLVDMQMTEGERAAALPDGVVIVAARPNADDCNIYAYSPALAARGTAVVPNDANRCDEIAAASSAAQGAIAYTYAAQVTEIRVQAINAAGTPGPSVDIGGGTLPAIASGGTLFRVTFRTPTGVYQVATVTSGLLMQTVDNLHPTPLRSAALASNAGEVIAMYATTDTPNQVFLRRFCGS
jgi:hypothetical protein